VYRGLEGSAATVFIIDGINQPRIVASYRRSVVVGRILNRPYRLRVVFILAQEVLGKIAYQLLSGVSHDIRAQTFHLLQFFFTDIYHIVLFILFVSREQQSLGQIGLCSKTGRPSYFTLCFGQSSSCIAEIVNQLVPQLLVGQIVIAHFIVLVVRGVLINPWKQLKTEFHIHVDMCTQKTEFGNPLVS